MDEAHKSLSKHRYEQALTSLSSANLLIQHGDYEGASNRTYYAVFHGMRSILALEEKDFSKHSADLTKKLLALHRTNDLNRAIEDE